MPRLDGEMHKVRFLRKQPNDNPRYRERREKKSSEKRRTLRTRHLFSSFVLRLRSSTRPRVLISGNAAIFSVLRALNFLIFGATSNEMGNGRFRLYLYGALLIYI